MLKSIFIELIKKHTDNNNLIEELWVEIENNYSNKKRHYHALTHLENLWIMVRTCGADNFKRTI